MTSPAVFRFGEHLLDAKRRLLQFGGEAVDLQPKMFETLLHLVRHADRVVTKDELLSTIWSRTIVTEDVLTRVVSALRKNLGDDASAPRYIRAVRGVGYRFVAPVETRAPSTPPSGQPQVLAVLPFQALASADRDEILEVGMADTLVARLSRLRELIVRPLASVRASLARKSDPSDVARELGVDAYLEASLQASGDRLRVNARLVSAAEGTALWSESFDERFAGIFELQDSICDRIVASLAPHVADPAGAPTRSALASPEAYRSYLEGRLFMDRRTPEEIRRAMGYFENALDLDPTYAEAWAALGECHELLGTDGGLAEHYTRARHAARRALALAPALPEAECLMAKIAWQHDWDWSGAEEAFQSALGRAPHRADLQIHYADYCCALGRTSEGLDHARRAVRIDPISPWCNSILAQAFYMAGRYSEAMQQAEHTLRLAPSFHFAELFAGLAKFCSGNHDEGIPHLEAAAVSERRDFLGVLGLCYGAAGRKDDAERVLSELEGDPKTPGFVVAMVYLGCGKPARAVAALERCLEDRDWHFLLLRSDPLLAPYRERARIKQLLERGGLR